jgi:signal transduction histidine kinase
MSSWWVALIVTAGYGLLIGLVFHHGVQRSRAGVWLTGFLISSAVIAVISVILEATDRLPMLRHIAMYFWALSTSCLLMLTVEYGGWGWRRWAIVGTVAWVSGVITLDQLTLDVLPLIGASVESLVRIPELNAGGVFFFFSWLVMAVSLLVLPFYGFTRAPLPLHANRLLYWGVTLLLLVLGQSLFALQSAVASLVGGGFQLLGAAGLLYGVMSLRVFDIRGSARTVLAFSLWTFLTATLINIGILITWLMTENLSFESAYPLLIGLALFLAVLYQLGRPWVESFITRVIISQGYDLTSTVETYARTIGTILEIEELASVAVGTINKVLAIRRGCVMLVTRENGEAAVQPISGLGQVPDEPMSFSWDSPFLAQIVERRQPLLQYDVDVLPEFHALSQAQRAWLGGLRMDVYAPIRADEELVGILAVGPLASGLPYRDGELKLLQVLAGQTAAALTNARLFADMKELNVEIGLLNEDLRRSNERFQIMDQVKTDFITIASHELRTPLTQIKGYADILDAMVEEGTLDTQDGRKLLDRVSEATEHLETVISAMLDSSQIDVDAMALDLSEVKLDSVLRIALEPMVEPIRERSISLAVRGIRDLPAITGDFQRLVQVVSNLGYNALKYTPDGGRVTISAEVLKDDEGDASEIELVFADTGVGIDPRNHELVFEKFFRAYDPQLHSTGNTKFMGAGPGLGLSIVRGIVEAHGGRIWVESPGYDPDRCPGSEFHVVLPIKASLPEVSAVAA